MAAGSAGRDEQRLGDLAVAQPRDQQPQDLDFTRGEAGRLRRIRRGRSRGRFPGGIGGFKRVGNGLLQGQGRPRKPRPEERRYDVGPGATKDGPKSGRGGAARGGAKGGPKQAQQGGRGRTAPGRSRENEARAEERNRERYAGKKDIKLPKTFPGAEQEGERLQKGLARAGYGAITTEILEAGPFYYAEDYHQQYLEANPNGYCGLGGTGVSCPIGVASDVSAR